MNMFVRILLQGILVIFFVCPWPAPLHADGVFRFPLFLVPTSLDPVKDELVSTIHVVQQVYDGLVAFDSNLRVSPGLAESWTVSRDGKEYLFNLRKGVRFHDGREVTAKDVVASLTRIFRPESQTGSRKFLYKIEGAQAFRDGNAQQISGIQVVGPDQVAIRLTEPYAAFLSVLAMPVTKIVPAELIENPGYPLDRKPVGTGPFRFISWEKDTITLAANPDHFRGAPELSEIRFAFYPGEKRDQAYPDFLVGKLDGCSLPGNADPVELREKGFQVLTRPRLSLLFYGMNLKKPPLDDPALRCAIAHAYDRERLSREVMQSKYPPAYQVLPPGMPGYSPDNTLLGYDIEKAKHLVKGSRYSKSGEIPELLIASVSHSDLAKKELQLFSENMEKIGIRVNPLFVENWELFKKGIEEGQYPLYRYAYYADIPDPEDFLPDLVETAAAHNFTGFSDPEVDSLLERARAEIDPVKRMSLYREAERKVLDAPPLIPVIYLTTQVAFQKNVRNVELPATGTPYLPLHRMTLTGNP